MDSSAPKAAGAGAQEHVIGVAADAGGGGEAAPQLEEAELSNMGRGFLMRASRRLRLSFYHKRVYSRESAFFSPEWSDAARHAGSHAGLPIPVDCTFGMRSCLSPATQQAVAGFLGSLPWHLFIILLSGFTLFAGPVARYLSAPSSADAWVNGFLVAGMAVFVGEVALGVLSHAESNWFRVVLDLLATGAILWDITWFADALSLQPGGATTAAAQATKMLRFIRVIQAVEAFVAAITLHVAMRRADRDGEGLDEVEDRLAPSNVGSRLREAATLQVAVVVVTTVAATALLLVRNTDKLVASLEGYASVLEVLVAAGASAATLGVVVADLQTFAASHLDGLLVPLVVSVAPSAMNWTLASAPVDGKYVSQVESSQGLVSMAVDSGGLASAAAKYEILIMAGMFVLLLLFVATMYFSIHKMLVVPLERIFNAIRKNAASVIEALGDADLEGPEGASAWPGGGGGARTRRDDDMSTIEAAVEKMSRIVNHFTSAGGVGLNSVKKFAEDADHSTKQWLATMVAGPAQEEVATAEREPKPSLRLRRVGAHGSTRSAGMAKADSHGSSRGSVELNRLFNLRSSVDHGPPVRSARRSTVGSPTLSNSSSSRQSVLALYLQKASPLASLPSMSTGKPYQRSRLSGVGPSVLGLPTGEITPAPDASNAAAPHKLPLSPAASIPFGSLIAATGPMGQPGPRASFRAAAAVAALERLERPQRALPQLASSALTEEQQQALGTVDLDFLHSFAFDALSMTRQQLVPFVVSMFVELELAYFTGSDLDMLGESEQIGFIDVPTLWRFAEEVERHYHDVPYHNFWHCVDVSHTTFAMIQRISRKVQMTALEKYALMIAALCHDMEHPGVNNAYLVNSKDPVAIMYNDNSVLENKHVACLYTLVEQKPEVDILKNLDLAQWKELRKIIIAAVLHTDMVHHFPMVSKIDVFYEMHSREISALHKALRRGTSVDDLPNLFSTAEERQLLHVLLLHCADISNPVKPAPIAERWTDRVLAEFFAQGDRERAAGQPVSPMCDRATTSRAAAQINFIEFVVAPIYATVVKVFPELWDLVVNLLNNREFWHAELVRELETDVRKTPLERAAELQKAEARMAAFADKYKDQFARRRRRYSSITLTTHSTTPAMGFGGSSFTIGPIGQGQPRPRASFLSSGLHDGMSLGSSSMGGTPSRHSEMGLSLAAAAGAAMHSLQRASRSGMDTVAVKPLLGSSSTLGLPPGVDRSSSGNNNSSSTGI